MKKLKKNSGFTLVEMLIVVAIIAILVAVSIPLVSSSLENARQQTDAANERAAKAEAIIMYLSGDYEKGESASGFTTTDDGKTYSGTYHAAEGSFVGSDTGYGKCTSSDFNHSGQTITATIRVSDGNVTITWSSGKTHIAPGT